MLTKLFLENPMLLVGVVVCVLLLVLLGAWERGKQARSIFDLRVTEDRPTIVDEYNDDVVVLGNMEAPADHEDGIWWHELTDEQKEEYGIFKTEGWGK